MSSNSLGTLWKRQSPADPLAASQPPPRATSGFYNKTPGKTHPQSSQDAELMAEIVAYRDKLGLMDRFWINRQTKAAIAQTYGELIVSLLEMQKGKLIFQMTVMQSDEKKRILMRSLAESGRIDQEIARVSNEFDRAMVNATLNTVLETYDDKATYMHSITEMHRAGRLADRDFEREFARVEKWFDDLRENLDAKTVLLMRNHAEKIERALALFQERHFGGNPL